jgi:hypothetical protein
MSYWGTGTKEDPYVCDTWDSLVERCANSNVSTEIYVEMAAKTQQGVLIPVNERVIDMRKWNWFLSDGTGGALVVPNRAYPIHINGNEWTILGASLRDCRLIVFRSNNIVNYVQNFTFKNIYLQGHSSLFAQAGTTAAVYTKRVLISNIRASGVLDLSTLSSIASANTNIALFNTDTGGENPGDHGFRVTACSFNFKYVAAFRLTNCNGKDGGTNAIKNFEFNNCLFNIEGKTTDVNTSMPSPVGAMYRYPFFGTFYFCKFTGSIYYDHPKNSTDVVFLYYNGGGTLDVIDFDVYCNSSVSSFSDTGRIVANSSISTAKIIQYHKTIFTHSVIGAVDRYHNTNAAAFLHPSSREEMCDRQWLLEQGFIIGTPPSD